MRISHTRGVSLSNLSGLCLILAQTRSPLGVRELANCAIDRGILDFQHQEKGDLLGTRINHHMIALRVLELAQSEKIGAGRRHYSLTANGHRIASIVECAQEEIVEMTAVLRDAWREILVESRYVRDQWLKYFMSDADFSLQELISYGDWISIYRLPVTEREQLRDRRGHLIDSGLRLESRHWGTRNLDERERREIYEGLRRWTNDVYLTDDRLPGDESSPFRHFNRSAEHGEFEIESHIVKAWFDPAEDLSRFEFLVQKLIDERGEGDRIGIPDLIIALSEKGQFAKDNIKEMLSALFYRRGGAYFFERGSRFLVDDAFNVRKKKDKPSVYYLKLEGAWRTSVVRYGSSNREERDEPQD